MDSLFAQLFDNANDGIFILDRQARFVEVNRKFTEMTGLSKEEIMGKTTEIFLPGGFAQSLERLEQTIKEGKLGPYELEVTTPLGKKVISFNAFAYFEGETPIGVMNIVRDVTVHRQAEEIIKRRLASEKVLSRISSRFVGVANLDAAINASLADMGALSKASRAYLFLSRGDGATIDNTHEWCGRGVSPQIDNLQNLPMTMFPWWMTKLGNGEVIHVEDVAQLPIEAKAEKEILESQDIKSILVLPVSVGEEFAGFIGLDNIRETGEWSDENVALLRVSAEIIGNALERKQAEEALRQSQKEYEALVNSVDGIVWEADAQNFQFSFVSQQAERLLGYPVQRWLTEPTFWQDHIHPDDQEWAMAFCVKSTVEKRAHQFEYRMIAADGRTVRLRDIVTVVVENNQPVKLRGIMVDITERKLTEEALRESEARYRSLVENANDGIASLTLDGVITGVNRGFEVMLGWSREELVGQHYHKFVTASTAALGDDRTRRALVGEKLPTIFEVEFVHKDGRVIPVEARTRFIFNQEGQPVGLQTICRDIAAKKELEQQRADFLAMLTHDIKNPLGIILGYAEILLEEARERGSLAEEDLLQRLKSNVVLVHSLVTNYLDLSKIEVGPLTLMKEPLGLNNILHQVGQQYEAEAQRRHLTLEFHLQQELPVVEGDALALERVFANLVHNALKFTPERGRVTVSSTQQNNEMVVRVADTGPGIAAEELPFIFERYRRTAASRSQEGIGLGLFIVKTLVEAHEGRIEAESTLGRGSCFAVFLPLISAHPVQG